MFGSTVEDSATGFAALVVSAYNLRWAFATLPLVEVFLSVALPMSSNCPVFRHCDDGCTLLSWLWKDIAITTVAFGIMYFAGQACQPMIDGFSEDGAGMMRRLIKAYQAADSQDQAKDLGIDSHGLFLAKLGFVASVLVVLLGSGWTLYGVGVVVANTFSCKFWTFFALAAIVGLKVCICAAAGLAIVTLVSDLIAGASGAGSFFGGRLAPVAADRYDGGGVGGESYGSIG
mmetsp:Transcript_23744/g.68341  ORF Transcript_23744/g.68341 Transcript_23744/m.68341 type:complete len:231 (+) Transcript_23744:182-874(+)